MKLKHQLCAAFGGMALMVLATGLLTYWSVASIEARTVDMDAAASNTQLALKLPDQMDLIRERGIKTLFIDDANDIRALDALREAGIRQNDATLQALQRSVTTDRGKALLEAASAARKSYRERETTLLRGARSADRDTLMASIDRQLGDSVKAYRTAFDALSEFQATRFQNSRDAAHATVNQAQTLAVASLLASIVIAVMLTAWILRSTQRTIGGDPQDAARSVALIASGDLAQHIPSAHPDSLLANMERMRVELNAVIGRLKLNAKQLVSFANELATASNDVAAGAGRGSESASSMAAAIEEMTTSITELSHNAAAAATSTQQTGTVAASGSAKVMRLSDSMTLLTASVTDAASKVTELGEQSEEIRSIVDLIKSIADQTNLLALNAAIEAARAGDEGRGFAVVADEVRMLAERTAQSTQDISAKIRNIQGNVESVIGMMSATVAQVAQGEQLATDGAKAITDIETATRSVITMVHNISDAIRENSMASEDIAKTVEHIAMQSEENSQSSSVVARTATQLSGLAGELNDMSGQFKTR